MKMFKRPNVLLLYTDQQRFDTISYGRELAIDTPNLNALCTGLVLGKLKERDQ